MRRPVLYLLLFVSALTIVVWGFSYFIQPVLSAEINTALSAFFLALIGVVGVVAGMMQFLVY